MQFQIEFSDELQASQAAQAYSLLPCRQTALRSASQRLGACTIPSYELAARMPQRQHTDWWLCWLKPCSAATDLPKKLASRRSNTSSLSR